MPEQNDKFKINFFYFLVTSSIVLLIIFIIIIGSYWNYWSKIWRIEDFYRTENMTTITPTINRFDPVSGDINAQLVIIEYTDFACPACKNANETLNEISKFYGQKIKIVFKALPVINQLTSQKAAIAAYCASDQKKFWEYKDLLFENNALLTDDTYLSLAKSLAFDSQIFSACLTSGKYDTLINNNLAEALKLQLTSVPTIYINNQKFEENIAVDKLKNIIDKKLNQ